VLGALVKEAADLPGVAEAADSIERSLGGPDGEAQARGAVERLALLAATAALAQGAPSDVAEAFARARLAAPAGRSYGTARLAAAEAVRLTDRALPR
jgi:putative acyl-CoA dehydrogenase